MRSISKTSLATSLAAVLALGLSACGNKHEVIHHAETEGVYVDVDELKYQVQISRQLNPAIPEDREFLIGVDEEEAELEEGETWFAVFVRIENDSDEEQLPATAFELEDQQENSYEPVEIAETNPFHFDASPIPPNSYVPNPDGVARQVTSIGGMLQLFKIKYESLDNRPVELVISSGSTDDVSTINIDI
jgi:hypothetical protein